MKDHSSMADFINLKSSVFIYSQKTASSFLSTDLNGISLIFRYMIYVMLPSHSTESKTNESTIPIAWHWRSLNKSQRHTCTGVTPWLFAPSFTLDVFQSQNNWHSGILPRARSRRNSTHDSRQNTFPFPSWGCWKFWLGAGIWGYFQVLNMWRARLHLMKSYLKNWNRYWIIQSVSLSFAKPFLTSSTMTLAILFQREKNAAFIWIPL